MKIPLVYLGKMLSRAKQGIIFAGHGVSTNWTDRATEEVHIDFANFCEIVDILQELDYDFLTMSQVLTLSENGFEHSKHWTHLTFDDGYRNNLETIYPYLRERGIPFSVFVSTHHIESQDYFPTFWLRAAEYLRLPLSSLFPDVALDGSVAQSIFEKKLHYAKLVDHEAIIDQVKSLFSEGDMKELENFKNDLPLSKSMLLELSADPLVHIGSHSHHHIIYHADQELDLARREMQTSRDLIAKTWAIENVPTFCYPNGDWSPKWAKLSLETGYPMSFTCESGYVGRRTQPFLMPRFWLSTRKRTLAICALSLLGNHALRFFGRPPLKRI
jgi:peptidoglycan/xylan/chitin deacetylase (PgdA/CDA1 family)